MAPRRADVMSQVIEEFVLCTHERAILHQDLARRNQEEGGSAPIYVKSRDRTIILVDEMLRDFCIHLDQMFGQDDSQRVLDADVQGNGEIESLVQNFFSKELEIVRANKWRRERLSSQITQSVYLAAYLADEYAIATFGSEDSWLLQETADVRAFMDLEVLGNISKILISGSHGGTLPSTARACQYIIEHWLRWIQLEMNKFEDAELES